MTSLMDESGKNDADDSFKDFRSRKDDKLPNVNERLGIVVFLETYY